MRRTRSPGSRRTPVSSGAVSYTHLEAAVCYLQVVLADELAGVGCERLCADMDTWGYSLSLIHI